MTIHTYIHLHNSRHAGTPKHRQNSALDENENSVMSCHVLHYIMYYELCLVLGSSIGESKLIEGCIMIIIVA